MSRFFEKLRPKNIIGILEGQQTQTQQQKNTLNSEENNENRENTSNNVDYLTVSNSPSFYNVSPMSASSNNVFLRVPSKSSMTTVDLAFDDGSSRRRQNSTNNKDSFYARLRRLSFKRKGAKGKESGGFASLFRSKSSLKMSLKDHESGHYYVTYTLDPNLVDIKITQQWRKDREQLWWLSTRQDLVAQDFI